MSVELLYTSAVQGLKQGSRGFCTVISTAGMPINLATRLEGLSAYRHIYPPNHPDAAKNPVNYSHLRISVGGRPVSILSRVADYGIDYSQRTNKLAHHVVVEAHEQTPAGPAWLMQSTSILRSRWDGQCATPASGPTVPMQDQTGKICTTWKSLSGDAGWGGVVADTFASAVGKPLWIIYDLGQREQLLTLLNEAIALLPHEKRWSATFSTYATNVPPDADCKVRCVPAGSDDARLAPAMGKVIDLTKKQAVLAVSELVTAAREGIVFTPKPVPSVPRPMVVEIPQVHSNAREPDLNDFELVEDDFEMKLKPIGPPSVTSSHLPPSPPPAVRSRPTSQPNYAQLSPDTPDSNSWMKWALIGTSVTIVCLMIAIGGLVYSSKFKDVAQKDQELDKSVEVKSGEDHSDKASSNDLAVAEGKLEQPEKSDPDTPNRDADQPADDISATGTNSGTPKAEEGVPSHEPLSPKEATRNSNEIVMEDLPTNTPTPQKESESTTSEPEISDVETIVLARIDIRELLKDKNPRLKLTVELKEPFDPVKQHVYSLEKGSGPLNLTHAPKLLGENEFAKSIRVEAVKPLLISIDLVGSNDTKRIANAIIQEWELMVLDVEKWNKTPQLRKIKLVPPEAKERLENFRNRFGVWRSEYAALHALILAEENRLKSLDVSGKISVADEVDLKAQRDLLDNINKHYLELDSLFVDLCSGKVMPSGPVLYLSEKASDSGDILTSVVSEGREPFQFKYVIESTSTGSTDDLQGRPPRDRRALRS